MVAQLNVSRKWKTTSKKSNFYLYLIKIDYDLSKKKNKTIKIPIAQVVFLVETVVHVYAKYRNDPLKTKEDNSIWKKYWRTGDGQMMDGSAWGKLR